MFKFLHRRALENSIKDIENCLRLYPEWDYAGPMSDVMTETLKVIPKGLNQTPCPATRAYCVDLVRLANKAHSIGLVNVWLALTVVNLYFSAWNIAYHDPKDTEALSIKKRARAIIDRFIKDDTTQPTGEDWYASFEDWYMIYRLMATAENDALKINNNGRSMFDFMDQAPLRRAYADRIDPVTLGTQFGKDFDISKFGK